MNRWRSGRRLGGGGGGHSQEATDLVGAALLGQQVLAGCPLATALAPPPAPPRPTTLAPPPAPPRPTTLAPPPVPTRPTTLATPPGHAHVS